MPTACQMLSAERYFQVTLQRIEEDRQDAIARVDPSQEIAQRAGIQGTAIRKVGVIDQMRADLRSSVGTIQVNQWVSWVIQVPPSATRSQERLETVSGYVTKTDMNSGQLQVKIQCNPQDSKELGYEYDKEVTVPIVAVIQVMKPMPVVQGGPTFSRGTGGLDYVKA